MTAILDRLDDLQLVLQWSTAHAELETALTPGQRIMVNQERGALLRCYGEPEQTTGFTQSPIVEDKVTRILYLIQRTKWVPKI